MSKIDNPVLFDLLKLKLIKTSNLKIINKRTRDCNKLNIYQDKFSEIIFLEKYKKKFNYYKTKKLNRKIIKNKSFSIFLDKKIKTLNLDDQKRRIKLFGKIFKNKKILDFGCGDGRFVKLLSNYSKHAYGLELNKTHLNRLNKKIKLFNNLKEVDFKFDFITMFHVLEHLPNQLEILKIFKDKLKHNGKLIIEVPHANDFLIKMNLKEFKNFTFWSEHLILHTENSLKKFLSSIGFKKIYIKYFQRYPLSNHIGWFNDKKPGGHNKYNKILNYNVEKNYKKFLEDNKISDTLIAIAKK